MLIFLDKELAAAKERQEIELTAQRATLQEQRTHIDILDTALGNAQRNVVRLEDEVNLYRINLVYIRLFLFSRKKCILQALNFKDANSNSEFPNKFYYRHLLFALSVARSRCT